MPLSIIWLVTSFAIKLLVLHFKLVILLRSRAKARFRGSGGQGREGGRDVVLADERLSAKRTPVRTISCPHE